MTTTPGNGPEDKDERDHPDLEHEQPPEVITTDEEDTGPGVGQGDPGDLPYDVPDAPGKLPDPPPDEG